MLGIKHLHRTETEHEGVTWRKPGGREGPSVGESTITHARPKKPSTKRRPKTQRLHVPIPICLCKIAQIPKSGFPYTDGIN